MRRWSPVNNREIGMQLDHKCEQTWGVTLGSHQQEALQRRQDDNSQDEHPGPGAELRHLEVTGVKTGALSSVQE